jgi:hypothetical protein
VDGQPPAGRESLGGSIGSGRRSCLRPVDSAASSSGCWRTPATSDCSFLSTASGRLALRELGGSAVPRSAKERCREPAALDAFVATVRAPPARLPAVARRVRAAWTRYRCTETTQSDYSRSWAAVPMIVLFVPHAAGDHSTSAGPFLLRGRTTTRSHPGPGTASGSAARKGNARWQPNPTTRPSLPRPATSIPPRWPTSCTCRPRPCPAGPRKAGCRS